MGAAEPRPPAPRTPARAHGLDAHRRPVSERRAGWDRPAARRLLVAARRRGTAVVKRSVLRLSIPLKRPFVTSAGVTNARELLLLRVEATDGTVGHGEAAPFEPYDGVPLER